MERLSFRRTTTEVPSLVELNRPCTLDVQAHDRRESDDAQGTCFLAATRIGIQLVATSRLTVLTLPTMWAASAAGRGDEPVADNQQPMLISRSEAFDDHAVSSLLANLNAD